MGDARCNCGAITLSLPEKPSKIVVACHCIDCQARSALPLEADIGEPICHDGFGPEGDIAGTAHHNTSKL